jgi:SPP1 family predicted phage head-tail adaptor
MQDSTLKLISYTQTKDKYGMPVKVESKTEIFCRVTSVSGSEFNAASQNGIKPQWKFIIRSREYSGEKVVEFEGQKFAIYRTYQSSLDDLELYVEEREGI